MTARCVDCGETLDQFGICPFADPERARVERAPVNCGHTVLDNTRTVQALFAPQRRGPVAGDPAFNGDHLADRVRIAGDQRGGT